MSISAVILKLQELDLALLRANKDLDARLQLERTRQLESAEREFKKRYLKIFGTRKDLEMEIADLSNQKEQAKQRIEEIYKQFEEKKVNKAQVKKLQESLSSLTKRIEKIDFTSSKLTAKLDEYASAETKATQVLERVKEEKASLQERIDADCTEIRSFIERAQEARTQLLEQLPKQDIARYEEALKKYGGLAVEQLKGNRPSICNVVLQPSQYQELKNSQEEIVTCPYCRRLLVVKEKDNECQTS